MLGVVNVTEPNVWKHLEIYNMDKGGIRRATYLIHTFHPVILHDI